MQLKKQPSNDQKMGNLSLNVKFVEMSIKSEKISVYALMALSILRNNGRNNIISTVVS